MKYAAEGGHECPPRVEMSAHPTPFLLSLINAPSAKLYIRMLGSRFHSAIFFDVRITEKEDFERANIGDGLGRHSCLPPFSALLFFQIWIPNPLTARSLRSLFLRFASRIAELNFEMQPKAN